MTDPPNDQKTIEEKWKSRGFSFGIFTDPPGQVWSDFIHPTDELVILVEGELELEMEGKKIQCEIGKEVLIPANTYHTARNVGPLPNKWFFGYKN